MELDITRFFESADPSRFSASVAELGSNVGKITWCAAADEAAQNSLLNTPEELESFRAHLKGYGAWEEEEIAGWTQQECEALLIQMISGDMREGGLDGVAVHDDDAWAEYAEGAEQGMYSGRIFRGDVEGAKGRVFYYIGD